MIIECTGCHAKYQYDEARFEQKPSKKIKCAKCSNVFEISNPAAARPLSQPAKSTPAAPKKVIGDDSTRSARPKPPIAETKENDAIEAPERITGKVGATLKLPEGTRLSVAILEGEGAGAVFRVSKPRIVIGRAGAGADIGLDDTEASRQHAAIEIRDTIYLLVDLSSKNGTLVEGQKITETVQLQDKSEFVIGGTTLMLIVTQES